MADEDINCFYLNGPNYVAISISIKNSHNTENNFTLRIYLIAIFTHDECIKNVCCSTVDIEKIWEKLNISTRLVKSIMIH